MKHEDLTPPPLCEAKREAEPTTLDVEAGIPPTAIDAALDQALDLAPEERLVFIRSLPADLADRVAELLTEVELDGPLDQALGDVMEHLLEVAGGEEPVNLGRTINGWRILGRLGAGGMGVVYLVERSGDDFDHRAALKVIRWELAETALTQRFLSERQILAQLNHQYIGTLIDGGVTENGLPYLVLEYVEGEPIDRYCALRNLDRRQRISLMVKVARTIDFAHRHLVVHRDIKPSNILVRADGTPKLLDFGIAKWLGEAHAKTTHLAPMTPRYAAPEQRCGEATTLAVDIWSLGALLKELVTPGDEEDPALGLEWPRGDLANILDKASHEDPEERYRSASDFADDLERFLEGRPVEATPPTWRYRVGRWAKRHRTAALAGLAALLIGVIGLITILWQAQQVRLERDRARVEAARAEQISSFLVALMGAAQDDENEELTTRKILDRGTESVRDENGIEPAARAEMLEALGRAYGGLGDGEEAAALFQEAAALRSASEVAAMVSTEAPSSEMQRP